MDRGTTDHDSGDAAVQGTPSIALFVTCLVDLMRPSVGFASLALLERAGCSVQVPAGQTCCGQPGYNSGDYAGARAVAQRTVTLLEGYDYVVIPSGSCAGMLRLHYPRLLEGAWRRRAEQLATRCYELTQFLHDVCGIDLQPAADTSTVAYHDACAGLRELGVRRQPRELLAAAGIDVCDPAQGEVCCGFGGTFCAKLPEVSAKMADDKLAALEATGADEVVAGDLGCLLALAGRAARRGSTLRFRHVAERLAGDTSAPAISGDTPSPPGA